jgi:polysaccharide biosynthesis/export protein
MIRTLLTMSALLPCLAAAASTTQLSERNPEYRLQPCDVVDLHYRYTPEFDQQVTIRPDGRITILGIGDVVAVSETLDQLTQTITDASRVRLKDPQLTIVLKEFQKPFVFVGGEVGTPGRFELRGQLTAIEAISLAGGFKNSSKHSQVLLLRKVNEEQAETRLIDLKKLINDRTLQEDIQLRSGDMVYVPQNKISKIERFVHWTDTGMLFNPGR